MTTLLQDLVDAQAERTPDAVAVHHGDERTTYAQLVRRANQVARVLRDHGCRRDDRVCVVAPVTANAIAAMLGVLKADAIYVPLGASAPVTLMAGAIRECRPVCVLTAGPTAFAIDELVAAGVVGGDTLVGSLERSPIAGQRFFTSFSMADAMVMSDRAAASRNRATNPATIVFKPADPNRGVVATHAGLARSASWARGYFDVRSGDRHAVTPELATDRVLLAVLAGCAGGATLVPFHPEGAHPRRLADFLRREGVTVWHATAEALAAAAAADVVSPGDLPALRHASWWTDGVSGTVVSYWTRRLGHTRFTSLYGAPEASTVSAHHVWREGAPIPSGAPLGAVCPGQELVLLDGQLEPVATDVVGDIWIRGLSLSPGYWSNASATAEVFRADTAGVGIHDRMWRTGDRGLRRSDGLLYLAGPEAEETWRGAAPSPTTATRALESGAGA